MSASRRASRPAVLLTAILLASTAPTIVHGQMWSSQLLAQSGVPANNSPANGQALINLADKTLDVRVSWSDLQHYPQSICIWVKRPESPEQSNDVALCLWDPIAQYQRQQDSHRFKVNLDRAQTYNRTFLQQHEKSVADARSTLIAALESGNAYVSIKTQQSPPGIEVGGTVRATSGQ